MNWLILDLSSAAVPDAEKYLKPAAERTAPANYSKPESIAKWQQEDFDDDLRRAALDWDLARITGIGLCCGTGQIQGRVYTEVMADERAEISHLTTVAGYIRNNETIIGYGLRNFDLPLLMRRARYLGVSFPEVNLDRFKTPVVDLCELLSHGDRQKQKPLSFYVRRLGWTDLHKNLTGKEEAQVFETGRWSDLAQSLSHDVEATRRLAVWAKVIK